MLQQREMEAFSGATQASAEEAQRMSHTPTDSDL